MDQKFISKMKLSAFVLSLVMMTACSSSQVDDENLAPETAAQAQTGDATTDAVPTADANVDPNAAPVAGADAPPVINPDSAGDAPQISPPVVADNSAPPAAAPDALAANPVTPPMDTTSVAVAGSDPVIDAAPVTETNPTQMDPAPVAETNNLPDEPAAMASVDEPSATPKKHKKHKKHSSAAMASNGEGVNYEVKKGDTLMKIAFEQYGDLYRWHEIYEANRDRIQDPNSVPPGTQLALNGSGMVQVEHNGERYLIKHGETLGVISQNVYGTPRKWKKLWENNRQLIKDPNKIYAGFYLYYQPENRLSHDSAPNDSSAEAPVVENPDSASNRPVQQAVPVANVGAPAANTAQVVNMAPAAVNTASNTGVNSARTPASVQNMQQPAQK